MGEEKLTITQELLDTLVDALSKLPYREIAAIFHMLASEIEAQKEDKPKIVLN